MYGGGAAGVIRLFSCDVVDSVGLYNYIKLLCVCWVGRAVSGGGLLNDFDESHKIDFDFGESLGGKRCPKSMVVFFGHLY